MPKISLNLRKEPTDVAPTSNTTFNAPGNYLPRYGKTDILVGGRGAPGNATTGGNYATTNPTTGGNYAGTNATTGGNYAGTNPTEPGNYLGSNPTGYIYMRNILQNIDPGSGTGFGYDDDPASGYYTEQDNLGSFYNVKPEPYSYWGFFNENRPLGAVYNIFSGQTLYSQFLGLTYTNGVPTSYSRNYLQQNGSPPTYVYAVITYNTMAIQPGGATYNPPTPGNAYYNPIYPGYPYYNPTIPGNANYNPVVPGTASGSYTLGGVTLSGAPADTNATEVLPTPSSLKYNGQSGITVTVPTGGYVVITSKATNT